MIAYNIMRGNPATLVKAVKPKGSQTVKAMGENLVNMAFTLPVYIDFKLNDFIVLDGEKYIINEDVQWEKAGKRKYSYSIQFQHEFYDLAKVQLKFLDPSNGYRQTKFDITGNASTIVGLVVESINQNYSGWSVGVVDDTDYKLFSFDATNCLKALYQLVDEFKTEVWFDNKTIHLQKRVQSSGLSLAYGKGNGLLNISRQNKTDANIITRLYVSGSSQNLPTGYRDNVGNLILPGGLNYYQDNAKVALYGLIEASLNFDIKPEREGSVTSVVAGDGNWKYFTDNTLDFDINAQLSAGLEAKVSFLTGQLAGYAFTINNYNHATKSFTINKNEDEKALDLPSNLFRPAVGDKYSLIDIVMPQSYVNDAEARLLAATLEYYNANSEPKFLVGYTASVDKLFVKQNNVNLQLGNTIVFPDAELGLNVELRIAGYTRDLENRDFYEEIEWADTLTVNEVARQSQQQQRTLRAIESSGLLNPDAIRKNIFLNRLSELNGYLMLSGQKVKAGLADFATDAAHAAIADYAWDADKWDGRQFADYLNQALRTTDAVEFLSVVADKINSKNFVSGFTGSGWKVDEQGNATFDNLTVRKQFNVYELVLNKISGTNGALAVTDSAKVKSVEQLGAYTYRCDIETDNSTIPVTFAVDDLLRCQVFNGSSMRYIFAKVIAVSTDSFTIFLENATAAPNAGDTFHRFGNLSNINRQGLLYLTASDNNAPYLDVLDGVTSESLTGKTKVRLGRLDGITDADLGDLSGYGLYGQNVFVKGKIVVTGGNAQTIAGSQVLANNAKLEAITQATTQASADATAKASAAQIAAIQTAANDAAIKIGNIQVGGRNLLTDSRNKTYNDIWRYVVGLNDNEIITVQVWGTGTIQCYVDNGYGSPGSVNTVNGYGKFTYTVMPHSNNPNSSGAVLLVCNLTNANIKVERGNKATDWTPAPEDVSDDATAKANAAQQAATNAAYAQAAYEREIAKAYADGIIDAEEAARIAQAAANLQAAKDDAQQKVNAVQVAANGYTDSQTQANLLLAQTYADSVATTKANAAQANAISQANTDAQAKANTAKSEAITAANAYAVTAANSAASQAEVNAAADALNKANTAYNNAVVNATAQYNALTANLKSLAYADVVELAKLGTTIIEGGKIKTTLLDADYIRANIVNAGYINTLNLDAAAIKSGIIDSARINAAQIISNGGGATVNFVNSSIDTATTMAQADATAKASAAQVAAIQTAANDAAIKIGNIQVGGRNLLTDSRNKTYNDIWRYIVGLNDNETITVQVWGTGTIQCYVDNGYGSPGSVNTVNGYGKFTYTVMPHSNSPNNNGWVLLVCNLTNANIKVERGNKATDWTPAPEDVSDDATAKANAAQQAATNAAYAQAAYEREIAKAYADGIVDAEEAARIAQAATNLQAAKDDATAKINTAVATANGYTDTKALATISAAQTYTDNVATTKANAAQANAISQASTDAQNKANAAQTAAATLSQQLVDGIKVGGRNLLTDSKNKTYNDGWRYISGLNDNETITVQVWGTGTIQCYVDNGYGYHGDAVAVNGYGKLTYTVMPYSNSPNNTGLVLFICNLTNANIKVERGNKGTDWTPAPEDVQTAIDNAKALADAANASYATLTANLKSLAYADVVELAKLGTTIIEGGKIKTTLLDADYIRANIVNAAYINTLEIVTKNLKTQATGKRVEVDSANNNIRILNDQNAVLIELDDDSAYEYSRLYFNGPPIGNTITKFYGPGIRVGNETAARTTMGRYGFTVFDENNAVKHKIGTYSNSNLLFDKEDVIFDIQNGFILKNVTASWDANNQYGTKQNIRVFAETISGDFGSAQVLTWTTV